MLRPAIVALILLFSSAQSALASIAAVESNYVRFYSAKSSSATTNQRLAVSLDALASEVERVTTAGFLKADGTWSDINYGETPSGYWGPWDHVRRLRLMAQAFQTPGQRFYRDAVLRGQIESAIAAVDSFYGVTKLPLGNWWFWTIGIPLDLGPTLVLMRNDVSPSVIEKARQTLAFRIGPNPNSSPVGPDLVGQNLVWGALNHLALGLLSNDEAMLYRVRDAIASVAVHVGAGRDGIKSDNSFHQHGAQLYTGGYGGSFANDVSRYFLFASGTAFALPENATAVFASYIADGVSWSLYGNYFDVSVISREVAKPSTSGYNGIAALLQSANASVPRRGEIASAAAKMLVSWQWSLPVELAALTSNITTPPAAPLGYRHYHDSDYSVVRRPSYFASIKMLSLRTRSGEKTNNENMLGSRQSDGRLYLTFNGREHFEPNVWPAFDWSRFPGTTVEQKPDAANASYGYGLRAFVGGTGDGRNGVAAMDFAAINSTVTARKAYFFLDDAIVFLSNGINATSTYPVETIVQQWPLSSSSRPFTADGSTFLSSEGETSIAARWLHADNIGYYFPDQSQVRVKRESRSGSWSSINLAASTSREAPRPFLTIWLDHGVAPRDAAAAYAIVPNVTAEQMRAWSASHPFTVIANDASVTAVRDNRTDATSFAFWLPGATADLAVDRPVLVHRARSNGTMTLAVADPTNGTSSVRVTIRGSWSLAAPVAGVSLSRAARNTTLTIDCSGGKTVLVQLNPIVRKRAVRRR